MHIFPHEMQYIVSIHASQAVGKSSSPFAATAAGTWRRRRQQRQRCDDVEGPSLLPTLFTLFSLLPHGGDGGGGRSHRRCLNDCLTDARAAAGCRVKPWESHTRDEGWICYHLIKGRNGEETNSSFMASANPLPFFIWDKIGVNHSANLSHYIRRH